MALSRGKTWWWNYFKEKFFSIYKHIRGNIILGNGHNEIEILLDPKLNTKRIFVAVEAEGIPVCAADVDMVGAIKTSNHSFIIYADIKSNTAIIYWLVEYSFDEEDNVDSI